MDICLQAYELEPAEEPAEKRPSAASTLLASMWVTLWTASEDAERVTLELSATLPLVTSTEATLN